ncbi:uncharacterized protein BJX67DRAFT_355158 [Aspergillus lucknowensis]|uniref:Uncharacterized protein n=1 Tax=Aspergillus lucknowensis TaxID=176173 RepID=A0ABR4LPX0_9EURO
MVKKDVVCIENSNKTRHLEIIIGKGGKQELGDVPRSAIEYGIRPISTLVPVLASCKECVQQNI